MAYTRSSAMMVSVKVDARLQKTSDALINFRTVLLLDGLAASWKIYVGTDIVPTIKSATVSDRRK
jgi:hypothetical protein